MPHADPATTWLTPGTAAALLHLHPTSLVDLVEKGELTCERTPGGHRRYRLADIERLRSQANPTSEAS